jgi:hypothetical protein
MILSCSLHFCVKNAAPILSKLIQLKAYVGSLLSTNSLFTNRRTSEDFPTAASPSKTNLTWININVNTWMGLRGAATPADGWTPAPAGVLDATLDIFVKVDG